MLIFEQTIIIENLTRLFYDFLSFVVGGISNSTAPSIGVFDLNNENSPTAIYNSTALNLCYRNVYFQNQEVTIEFTRPLQLPDFADIGDVTSVDIVFSVSMRPAVITPTVVLTQHAYPSSAYGFGSINLLTGSITLDNTIQHLKNAHGNCHLSYVYCYYI